MNLADIIKIKIDLENEGYGVLCPITKSRYDCFSDTTVTLGLLVQEQFRLTSHIDLFNQTVYMVDYYSYPRDTVFRWVNPAWGKMFAKELFERQEDPTVTLEGMQIRTYNDDVSIPYIIRGDMLGLKIQSGYEKTHSDKEEYESVELELTDSELATIARAAHVKDITINDFINEALRIELDRVSPDWREEYKNGYGGNYSAGC